MAMVFSPLLSCESTGGKLSYLFNGNFIIICRHWMKKKVNLKCVCVSLLREKISNTIFPVKTLSKLSTIEAEMATHKWIICWLIEARICNYPNLLINIQCLGNQSKIDEWILTEIVASFYWYWYEKKKTKKKYFQTYSNNIVGFWFVNSFQFITKQLQIFAQWWTERVASV